MAALPHVTGQHTGLKKRRPMCLPLDSLLPSQTWPFASCACLTSEHGPALTYHQKIDFVNMLQTMFIDGRIWDWDSEGDDPTPLSLAWNTAREAKPLYYGEGKVVHPFS